MSTDIQFARMGFPTLRDRATDVEEAAARARGHAAGFVAGLRDAGIESEAREAQREAEAAETAQQQRERADRALATLAAAARALQERTVPLLADAQHVLAASAIELAEAILGRELASGEASARSAIERALRDVDSVAVQIVRLNPADLAELSDDDRASTGVTFAADPSLDRGDAVTEFADGYLDARISTAVARARTALLGDE